MRSRLVKRLSSWPIIAACANQTKKNSTAALDRVIATSRDALVVDRAERGTKRDKPGASRQRRSLN